MSLVHPTDSLARQNEKLMRIAEALMRRVEQSPDQAGMAYSQFERAALLESEVKQRTEDLERALDLLHESNAQLAVATEEAEESRAYLADAIETIDEGFALFDAGDELVMHNTRFCEDMPDVRAQLVPGTHFTDYVSLISHSPVLERETGESPADWQRARMSRHAYEHVVFNVRLSQDRWLQVSEHRTRTGGTVVLQTDVTGLMRDERRERERLLDRQAKLLRATLDHLNQGVCIFDRDGRLVGWNHRMERLLNGYLAERVLGLQFSTLLEKLDEIFDFRGEFSRADMQDWAASRGSRQPITFEVQRGMTGVFDVFAQQMPDRGFVISFTDVTRERRQSQALRELNDTLEKRVNDRTRALGAALEDARRANASKTRFVAAASHDLLQPMSAAKLYAAALEERVKAPDDKALAQRTMSALESAEGIIEALLDISKLDSGLATFEVGTVRLSAILQALATEFAPIAARRGIALTVVPSDLRVQSDRVYLRRIVQNLVSNAIRYTTGDKVLLGVRRAGGSARIEVWDRGPGIDPSHHDEIFQEFRQLEDGKSAGQGLGLGLAIVERACRMLDHRLDLRSAPGDGSCFSVTAGLAAPLEDEPARDPDPADIPAATQGRLVCLVENDTELAQSITLTMENFGSDVIWAPNAEAALELLRDLDIVPDAFLVDYQLGSGCNGLDLLDKLAALYGPVPAQVISADRSPEFLAQCQLRGVKLLPKPLSRDVLGAFLEAIPVPVSATFLR